MDNYSSKIYEIGSHILDKIEDTGANVGIDYQSVIASQGVKRN